jgi:CheY-like chemotaxis protein
MHAIAPMTVLVVDDEAHVRELLALSLGRRGHRVLAIDDGARLSDALRELATAQRLCALVDLTMPGQDGRDVVRGIRAARPDVPVVLMSGHSAEHLQAIAGELGADGCVAKPFVPADVEQAVARALAGRVRTSTTGDCEPARRPPRASAS